MHLEFRQEGGFLVAYLDGELDISWAEVFKKKMHQELRKRGAHSFVLNLKALNFVDSTGLAALLSHHKSLAQGGGKMILSEIPPKVYSMIDMAGLASFMFIARDDQDAIKILKGGIS